METNFIFTRLPLYLPTASKQRIMSFRLTSVLLFLLGIASSCSSLRQTTASTPQSKPAVVNRNPKFLENISVTPESSTSQSSELNRSGRKNSSKAGQGSYSSDIEKATSLQFKYALLLNTEVEEIHDPVLFQFIDDWYGTRYCMGGTTKNCVDCSAFVQTFFSSVYGLTIPRTAKEQYSATDKIPVTKLKQGDLLFFNTTGGVSHVGIYLQNNKFVHASTSGGVMISDMSEPYYSRRFIRAGRVDMQTETAVKK